MALAEVYQAEANIHRPPPTLLHMLHWLGSIDDDAAEVLLTAMNDIGLSPEQVVRLKPDHLHTATELTMRRFRYLGGFDRFPDVWVRWRLHEWPWSQQRQIMRAVAAHRKLAVHSCHGIGKDWTAARIISWWLTENPPNSAFVISTAPTFAQVRAILWREVRQAHRTGNLPGRVNMTQWLINDDLVGFGRKPADHDEHTFQGIHALRVLVVLDEAGGVPVGLFEDAERMVTTEQSRILAIGNPDREGSYWHQVCTDPRLGWEVLHVSAEDTPNFTGEYVPDNVRPLLVSKLWAREQRERYGEGSAEYLGRVLGVFPSIAAQTVVTMEMYRAASRRPQVDGPTDALARLAAAAAGGYDVQLGCDIGGGGNDPSVIRERRGRRAGRQWIVHSSDSQEIADAIADAARETGAHRICIDSIGVGFGVVGLVRERVGVPVHPIEVSESSSVWQRDDGSTFRLGEGEAPPEGAMRVFNSLRDEMWWAARERCLLAKDPSVRTVIPGLEPWDLSELDAADGDDPTVVELVTPGYEWVMKGGTRVIKVEGKESLRKAARLGRSTDCADALLLAFHPPAVPPLPAAEYGGRSSIGNRGQGQRSAPLVNRGGRSAPLTRR